MWSAALYQGDAHADAGPGAGGSDRDSSALDGFLLRPGIDVLSGRPSPWLRATGRRLGRRDHVLCRVDPLHRRRGATELAGVDRMAIGRSRRTRGVVVRDRPVRRDAFFNVTTYQAMQVALTSSDYDRLVWRPDWRGSICFLVSGAIAYRASPRRAWHGWLPARGSEGWWQPAVNLLGCIFFGISAVAGYVVPSTGSMIDLAAANWNTSLGAACFLACALDTFHAGRAERRRRAERCANSSTARVRSRASDRLAAREPRCQFAALLCGGDSTGMQGLRAAIA